MSDLFVRAHARACVCLFCARVSVWRRVWHQHNGDADAVCARIVWSWCAGRTRHFRLSSRQNAKRTSAPDVFMHIRCGATCETGCCDALVWCRCKRNATFSSIYGAAALMNVHIVAGVVLLPLLLIRRPYPNYRKHLCVHASVHMVHLEMRTIS